MRGRFAAVARGQADEDVGLSRVGDAVVELGDAARPDAARRSRRKLPRSSGIVTANSASRSSPTSARSATNRSRSKFMFAPQVMADAASRPAARARATYCLSAGDGQRPGRLEDAAGVLEHVLDGGADRVGVDDDELVDQLAGQAERLLADQLDGRAVGEQADVVERDPLARAGPSGPSRRSRPSARRSP